MVGRTTIEAMSNTVITNFRDASGPRSSADSPFVVVLERDGTISLDSAALDGLVSGDGSSGGISVVRVGQEGKPEDATDSETEDDGVPHVTLSVDGYYDDPSGIAKYDSGIEMLQSLSNETREHSLIGFQNDHCYTPLTSPEQTLPPNSEEIRYDETRAEFLPPQKSSIPSSKKITILEQQIIPKGKKLVFNPAKAQAPVIIKGNDVLTKPLPGLATKLKKPTNATALHGKDKQNVTYNSGSEKTESSGSSTSGESINDRDSDSDYKYKRDHLSPTKLRKSKPMLKGIKKVISKSYGNVKTLNKAISKTKPKSLIRQEIKDKILHKKSKLLIGKKPHASILHKKSEPPASTSDAVASKEPPKNETKLEASKPQKNVKKEKKTPTALLSDMTSLFTSPDVMRRVSTDGKLLPKSDKSSVPVGKEDSTPEIHMEVSESKPSTKPTPIKTYSKPKDRVNIAEKMVKEIESIPQIDEASLAQLLQDTPSITESAGGLGVPTTTAVNPLSCPHLLANTLAGPLSPTLDLLAGLQPEEEGLTEDLLMHVAQLVESSDNLKEVIDKQVLGKVEPVVLKPTPSQPLQTLLQAASNKLHKPCTPRKDPIQIVRRDGRVINLPPIEAPATRSSKRKSQPAEPEVALQDPQPVPVTPELPSMQVNPKQYSNKKLSLTKTEPSPQSSGTANTLLQNTSVSDDSLNSEDDPYRLWCICKQPHNNRFMICCDRCEDWFHGKCVNITKAMGQQMEEQGIEWTCPNCIKKYHKSTPKQPALTRRSTDGQKESSRPGASPSLRKAPDLGGAGCIVCEKSARAGSIYCSDACILRHAQDSLGTQTSASDRSSPANKSESRVIVFERKTGRVLQGPNAPTAENLKSWLQEHPTFEVVRRERENKPMVNVKKAPARPPQKIQTTLKFDKQQKQIILLQPQSRSPQGDSKPVKPVPQSPQEEKLKTPISSKPNPPARPQLKQTLLTPKDGSTTPKQGTPTQKQAPQTPKSPEYKKVPAKITPVRTQSSTEKQTSMKSPTTPTPRKREREPEPKPKMNSSEPIRENVRKAVQEHMTLRFSESKGAKFSEEEIKKFAVDIELEMHNLFKEVSIKYKAKYRSLIFNIKDRKNLSLWQKICDRTLTPKQLVHMSPEELASQELAQWRDKEVKYQLELIKKSELDLLAANKTYVLKTHKGEEVMENKKAVATELDPNVSVEDLVTALNDSTGAEETSGHDKDDKHIRHKEQSRRKSPSRERESRARSSSRHKKTKEVKKKSSKGKDDKEKKVEERRSRRERNKSRSRDRTRDRSKPRGDKKEAKSKEGKQSPISERKARSRSRERSKQRSRSRERSRHRSRSKRHSQLRSQSHERLHRSMSQENDYHSKDKYSSKESETVERPKSALQKEAHPEYDPHEPMITSAFSEEELRRSREASLEQSFGDENPDKESEDYDPATFSLHSHLRLSLPSSGRVDRIPSEADSDQEPSSTVDTSAPPVWSGLVNMVDVARFYVSAHEVSGNCSDLEEELSVELDIVGRINPETVWDYISKMKKTGNKDILVLRLTSSPVATVEERMQYIALYSYLSSRNRLGVVKVSTTSVKDFYIFPLAAAAPLPPVLAPLAGPGLDEGRNHLLLAIIVRQRKKRHAPAAADLPPTKLTRRKSGALTRSYTPPVGGESYTPPSSPARCASGGGGALRLPLPFVPPTPALSTSVKDKIAASLASADEEPYSPGSSSGSSVGGGGGGADALRSRVDEINRQIEEQKQQILSMSSTIRPAVPPSQDEDEAYSPSRPMTPPPPRPALADISLPSNLQEILATIQQRSAAPSSAAAVASVAAATPPPPPADVDMRVPPPPPTGVLHALSEEELLRMVPDTID